jgi:hypothetical protein
MNKFLVISILTLIFVGTSPVSAWTPFEHSSKDWTWKDWSFFGGMLGAGILAITGGFFYLYHVWPQNRITVPSQDNMASQFVKRMPSVMTNLFLCID